MAILAEVRGMSSHVDLIVQREEGKTGRKGRVVIWGIEIVR